MSEFSQNTSQNYNYAPQGSYTPYPSHSNPSSQNRGGRTSHSVPDENNKNPVHTVFFFNILFTIKKDEFMRFAEKFGEIKNVYERPDKGFYFVTYYDIRCAKKAVDEAPNESLQGRPVKANYAYKADHTKKDPICATISVTLSQESSEISEMDVQDACSAFGEVRTCSHDAQNATKYYVKYFDLRAVKRAVENQAPLFIKGVPFTVEMKIGEDDGLEQERESRERTRERRGGDRRDNRNRNNNNNRYNNMQAPPPPYGAPPPYGYPYMPYGAQPYGAQSYGVPPPYAAAAGGYPSYAPPYGQAPPAYGVQSQQPVAQPQQQQPPYGVPPQQQQQANQAQQPTYGAPVQQQQQPSYSAQPPPQPVYSPNYTQQTSQIAQEQPQYSQSQYQAPQPLPLQETPAPAQNENSSKGNLSKLAELLGVI